ncbi:hypothetical protein ACFVMC_32970 [Nocardia sp. NPDC127579]|uniref:hypothetical protein n=1 Tax=Nocardia sp. NPDC127579 TaxID=3345402 RepID=UPI0036324015
MALYDLLYDELRRTLRAPSVSRKTFQAWAIAESECADIVTGRECRPSVRHLSRKIVRCARTVKRCRELARLLDVRQVVVTGRHRTKLERLLSWKRDDRHRGWTAEAALIDSPSYAHLVDNSTLESLAQQGFVTPLPRSGGSLDLSRPPSVPLSKNVTKGRAPRGNEKKRARRKSPDYDERALLLASRIRADARFPLWVRKMGRNGLAGVLTKRAIAGWTADDVLQALDQFLLSGKKIFTNPDNPYGYLASLLHPIPVDEPPALLDRAREAAKEEARRAAVRREWEQLRADTIAAAAAAATEDSPGRAAAMAWSAEHGRRVVGKSAMRHQGVEAARREIARERR